jgi:hypothetical protein
MIRRIKRLLHLSRAPATDLDQTVGKSEFEPSPAFPLEPFPECLLHCVGERLPRRLGKLPGKIIRFLVLDCERHGFAFLHTYGAFSDPTVPDFFHFAYSTGLCLVSIAPPSLRACRRAQNGSSGQRCSMR